MNSEEALTILSVFLGKERLKDVQELVFRQSWLGKTYQEIAEESGYSLEHIRDVGFRLWQYLSEVVGEKITKSNIHTILRQYAHPLKNPALGDRASRELMPGLRPLRWDGEDLLVADQGVVSPLAGLEFPGNPLSLRSPVYVDRPPIEQRCYQAIDQGGALVRIKAPRKMGKTSLLNRILHYAMGQGYTRARLNLQQADQDAFEDINCFLRWLCKSISWKLNLDSCLEDYWDQDAGLAKSSCTRYFGDYLLEQVSAPLVLALDEVDRIFAHPRLAQDFLPLLRVWHEEANESETWQRLRLVVLHSTEVYIPLNVNQSPFNVGLPIRLSEWNADQVETLALRYGLAWSQAATQQLMQLTSGHPYLVQLALYQLWNGEEEYDQLLQQAPTESGIYGAYLRQQLDNLRAAPQLATAMKQVVSGDRSVVLEPAIAYHLQSMGLIKFSGNDVLPSCQLYRHYFRARL